MPTLARLCMAQLTQSFAQRPVLRELPEKYQAQLLGTLGTDVPLAVTAQLIDDDTYWKRCCVARWPMREARGPRGCWKQLFFESHLQGA